MIYTAPINQITWGDLTTFCEQQKSEDAYLDYKKDFPDRLEATIAAMANTIGGVILIGVEEEKKQQAEGAYCWHSIHERPARTSDQHHTQQYYAPRVPRDSGMPEYIR